MLELTEIKKDLQAKEDLVKALHLEAHKLQYVLYIFLIKESGDFLNIISSFF